MARAGTIAARRGAARAQANGRAFEALLEPIHDAYRQQGVATIRKVDPPTKVVGKGRIIYLENPFLDYVGSWTDQAGRTIVMEAKSTRDHRLSIGKAKGGLTSGQIDQMAEWHRGGAATGLVWEHRGEIKVVTFDTIEFALACGNASLRFGDFRPTRRGMGMIHQDWLAEFADLLG